MALPPGEGDGHKAASTPENRRLSPLVHEHINLHGRYHFGLTEALQRGELRALRDPRNAMQEL